MLAQLPPREEEIVFAFYLARQDLADGEDYGGVTVLTLDARHRIPRKSSREIGMARTAGVASGRLATIRLPDNVVPRPDSAAISIRRVARLSRNVGQPDHILANPIISHKAERRPGPAKYGLP